MNSNNTIERAMNKQSHNNMAEWIVNDAINASNPNITMCKLFCHAASNKIIENLIEIKIDVTQDGVTDAINQLIASGWCISIPANNDYDSINK